MEMKIPEFLVDPLDRQSFDMFLMVLFASLVMVLLWCHPAHAAVLIYGSNPNYSAVVLPNNSYVMQGQNISQGNYYDLSGIYGFSGEIAHWNNDDSAGMKTPDHIITLIHPERFYIDPEKMPVGRWYQWDGASCDRSGVCTIGFGHGNAYVFAVVKKQDLPNNTTSEVSYYANSVIYHNETIRIYGGNNTVEVTVTVRSDQPVSSVQPATAKNITTIVIPQTSKPTQSSDIKTVTRKSPVSMFVPVLAIVMAGVVLWRRK